jgi:hypothetical protein
MKKLVTLVSIFSLLLISSYTHAATPRSVQPAISVLPVSDGEPQPHPQTIYVKARINLATVLIPVPVFFTDLVLWVKQDIADILDIPIDSFELTFNNVILDEDLPLNAYGITTNSILGLRRL